MDGENDAARTLQNHEGSQKQEELVEWAQMKLERVDVTSEVLADLLEEAYKAGEDAGYQKGKLDDHVFSHFTED